MSAFLRWLAVAAAGALLAACSLVHSDNYGTPQSVRPSFADHTFLFYDYSDGGRFAEYLAADGAAYLWGGSERVWRGEWRIGSDDALGNSLCTRYEPYKYNPITGVDGSKWSCSLASMFHNQSMDSVAGDPFGLARRTRMPFSRRHEEASDIEKIAARLPAAP